MTTDPLLQRTYEDGFGEAIDEINWYVEQLTAAWGSVAIACDNLGCQVSDGNVSRVYEAPTLLDALCAAAEKEATP